MLVPLIAGLSAFLIANDRRRRVLLVAASAAHLVLTISVLIARPEIAPGAWFGLDALGLLFLAVISGLFFGASVYAVKYLSF